MSVSSNNTYHRPLLRLRTLMFSMFCSAFRPVPTTTNCCTQGRKMDAMPPTRPNTAIHPPMSTSLRCINLFLPEVLASSHRGHGMD